MFPVTGLLISFGSCAEALKMPPPSAWSGCAEKAVLAVTGLLISVRGPLL
jgi:hypothetical protein